MVERIVEFGKKVWSLMTDEEQVNCRVTGTYQFVEYIIDLLGFYDIDWSNVDFIEDIHNKIFN